MEEKFDLVTGVNFKEIDADHYLFEIDGISAGSVDLNRWGFFNRLRDTALGVANIVNIWS